MKPAGPLLLFTTGLMAARLVADPSPSPVSRELSAKIREGLPAYQAPPPQTNKEASANDPAPPGDPDVLVLPTVTIKEKRLPPDAADHLMNRRDFKRKMENLYLDEIARDGPLNYFLNNFTIPILSPSKAERGKAIYIRRELDRLRHVTEAGGGAGATRQMERELDNRRTTDPAGGLRK